MTTRTEPAQAAALATVPEERVAVVGLGYVGLPVALAIADAFPGTVGFDVDGSRIRDLTRGTDRSHGVAPDALRASTITLTSDPADLRDATVFVAAVPTPVDANRQPDLAPLRAACRTIGGYLKPGDVVVFESTVYPGVTEEVCGPMLAKASGLRQGVDFKLGYSPERINPGDDRHTLQTIVKVVAGEDRETLERVARIYEAIVPAGVHRAPSIKVAEAAKVIENTQRDLNIALVNELAIIFDRLGIRTKDVLDAAGTKWNFLPFSPGLVGGHCIGVDPYYLTAKAEQVGYHPEVILAGRRINDGMGAFVAHKVIKLLANADVRIRGARVGILGLTFKSDVPDLRNSKVPDIRNELRQFGIDPLVHDPLADPAMARHEYGIALSDWNDLHDMDVLILAVPHGRFVSLPVPALLAPLRHGGTLVDVKSVVDPSAVPGHLAYWSL